jgi:hypothetical protein
LDIFCYPRLPCDNFFIIQRWFLLRPQRWFLLRRQRWFLLRRQL